MALLAGTGGCRWLCAEQPVDPRLSKAESYVRSGRLIGLEQGELGEILGPPYRLRSIGDADLTYYLGNDSACVDSRWLTLKVSGDGRVTEARIETD